MTPQEQTEYLKELKNYVLLHCKAQQLNAQWVQQVLSRITRAEGNEPGSWCAEWCRLAQQQEQQQNWADATKLFNIARFPFAESEMQIKAHLSCIENFKKSMNKSGIRITTLSSGNGEFKAYATGLDRGWPVLVVCGGIISLKEQWQRFLLQAQRLKLCIVTSEMPGVGENTMCYTPQSWTLFPQILDLLEGRADTRQCHLMAMSFSGHLALQAAAVDTRIRGITTVGAPIASFFHQYSNATVPKVTQRTLSHLTGLTQELLFIQIRNWQIDPGKMPRLTIPVHYLQSEYDEIISSSESHVLNEISSNVHIYKLPDVHGSPNNMHLVAPWAIASIMSTFPARRKQAFIFKTLWKIKTLLSGRLR